MQLFNRTCDYGVMNVERIAARGFVVFGGLIWAVAALASPYGNRTVSMLTSGLNSLALIALTVAVFALGYFYERLAALLLLVAAVGVIVWGIVAGWGSGEWMYMGTVLIGPMAIAGLMFWLAARMENVCQLKEEMASSGRADGGTQASA